MAHVLTIGHSTRALDGFIDILQSHRVERLVDVRTVPRSRTNPQFNRETLPAALAAAGIQYDHAPDLGGLRKPRPDSPNSGWRNASFRGYADYMQTEKFAAALARLSADAEQQRTAIMCAEAVHWRCHRSLIADALHAQGHTAAHIASARRANPHQLTSFAVVVENGQVLYSGVSSD
jgi:uncharacterized protein (DUF488 family)